jgi:4a-hydroxytetrahydrobiopterin dehydratase
MGFRPSLDTSLVGNMRGTTIGQGIERSTEMADLAEKHAAADGTALRLTDEQVTELVAQVSGWQVADGRLRRDAQVKNFRAAVTLVNSIADVAEEQNHHPDLCILGWNNVRIELYTHTAGGLSENDFIMAAKFNRLLPAAEKA